MNASTLNPEQKQLKGRMRTGLMSRSGAAAVEAAIIMPLLILITLGGIDIAQYINLSQLVSNSSREAARVASREKTQSVTEVELAVLDYIRDWYPDLSDASLKAAASVVVRRADSTPIPEGDLGEIESGEGLRVDVGFDFDTIRWLPGPNYHIQSNKVTTTFFRRD